MKSAKKKIYDEKEKKWNLKILESAGGGGGGGYIGLRGYGGD